MNTESPVSLQQPVSRQREWLDQNETIGGVLVNELRNIYERIMKQPAVFPTERQERDSLLVMANDYCRDTKD